MADDTNPSLTPPAPDHSGLLDMIARSRAELAEARFFHATPHAQRPTGNPFVGQPAAIEEREVYLRSLLVRAGLDPETPAETPQQRVELELDARYNNPPALSDSTVELVDAELERLEALGSDERARLVADLRRELGEEQYTRLVSEAKEGVIDGAWEPAIEASAPVLRLLSAYGRINRAHARERATLDATLRR